jgi:hypothetical protein
LHWRGAVERDSFKVSAVQPQDGVFQESSFRTAIARVPSLPTLIVTMIGRQQTWQSSMYSWSSMLQSISISIGSPQLGHSTVRDSTVFIA